MHGLGNDFVVFDCINQDMIMTPEFARRIADRHFGIGCDQILLVEQPQTSNADFSYRIWNADGGEVEQCGNGARCFARFVYEKNLRKKKEIGVDTLSGIIILNLDNDGNVTVNMGMPKFDPKHIPFIDGTFDVIQPLEVGRSTLEITFISMGNPHAVQIVDDVDVAPVITQGPLIENHVRFPKRINVEYVQVMDRSHIRLRVWERGAGETIACGTGTCAAVVAGIRRGLLDPIVAVTTKGGELTIRWDGDGVNSPVWMTGPAVTVFEGEIKI